MRPSTVDWTLFGTFLAALAATFVLAGAYVAVAFAYPEDNLKALPSWIVLQSAVATAESVALAISFVLLAGTWYHGGRVGVPPVPSRAGIVVTVVGAGLGAAGHIAYTSILQSGQYLMPLDMRYIVLGALMIVSLPLVALGLGLMARPRARPDVLPPPPE